MRTASAASRSDRRPRATPMRCQIEREVAELGGGVHDPVERRAAEPSMAVVDPPVEGRDLAVSRPGRCRARATSPGRRRRAAEGLAAEDLVQGPGAYRGRLPLERDAAGNGKAISSGLRRAVRSSSPRRRASSGSPPNAGHHAWNEHQSHRRPGLGLEAVAWRWPAGSSARRRRPSCSMNRGDWSDGVQVMAMPSPR